VIVTIGFCAIFLLPLLFGIQKKRLRLFRFLEYNMSFPLWQAVSLQERFRKVKSCFWKKEDRERKMKKIYIEIKEQYRDRELERLLEELRTEGIEVCRLAETQLEEGEGGRSAESWRKAFENGEGTLVLTDRQTTADQAAAQGIACVGYEPPGAETALSHVDMVIQGFEELNAEFFRLVYRRHHGLPWTIAETERLWIRESVPEDFDILYAIYQEPGMTEYMPGMEGEKEEEREVFTAYIRRMYPFFSYGLWTVIEKAGGKVIGRAGLENGTYRGKPVLELGYMVAGAYQHQGYGLEAVKAVMDYAFSALGADQVYAFIHRKNTASRSLIQKAGFQEVEGERKEILVFQL